MHVAAPFVVTVKVVVFDRWPLPLMPIGNGLTLSPVTMHEPGGMEVVVVDGWVVEVVDEGDVVVDDPDGCVVVTGAVVVVVLDVVVVGANVCGEPTMPMVAVPLIVIVPTTAPAGVSGV